MGRKLLWASLVLAPLDLRPRLRLRRRRRTLFVFSAASLVPLAWLIGEATEHAGEHTGPGHRRLPERELRQRARADHRPVRDRGRAAGGRARLADGSIVSNLLLVLAWRSSPGGQRRSLDRRSLLGPLALVLAAVLLFLIPSCRLDRQPRRHSLAVATAAGRGRAAPRLPGRDGAGPAPAPPAARRERRREAGRMVAAVGARRARRGDPGHRVRQRDPVHSLDAFSHAVGLREFFTAAVIVAIVGNAAEHGGAIVDRPARQPQLATEIAVSSAPRWRCS